MKVSAWLRIVSALLLLLVAGCTDSDPEDSATSDPPEQAAELGAVVPEITLYTPDEATAPENFNSAPIIANALRELGFEVTVESVELFALFRQVFEERDYGVSLYQWTSRSDRLDPFFYLSLALPDSYIGSSWQNDDYLRLMDEQKVTLDPVERRDIIFQLQEILADPDELPLTVTFSGDNVSFYNNERFDNLAAAQGEGLYSPWIMNAEPLADDRVLRIGAPFDPETLNPMAASSAQAWAVLRMFYDPLVRIDPEAQVQPWAAQSVEFSEPTTVEVVLRDDMTFTDGRPVTVEDVKFTYDFFTANEVAYFQPFLRSLESVEIVDDNTLHFNLTDADSSFIGVSLAQFPILPRHIWEGLANPTELTPEQVPTVGSGPFAFQSFAPRELLRLTSNPGHFDADNVQIAGIDFVSFADADGVVTALQTQQIDMHTNGLQPAQVGVLSEIDYLTEVSVPSIGYNFMVFNVDEAPFDDVAVRQAFAHAVDREGLVETVTAGRGDLGTSVITPGNPMWHNPDVTAYTYDLDLAREILQEAGYGWDDEGRIHYGG